MARIRVYRDEANGKDFPRMCMCCGRPAEVDVPHNFAWMPSWVMIFIFFGLLPWLLVMFFTRKTMRVVVPMCLQHQGHWRVRMLYVWLGLLFWITYVIALVVSNDEIPTGTMTILIVAGLLGALVWLVSAAIWMNNAIKPLEIRDKGIELTNVNKNFAHAWNKMID